MDALENREMTKEKDVFLPENLLPQPQIPSYFSLVRTLGSIFNAPQISDIILFFLYVYKYRDM